MMKNPVIYKSLVFGVIVLFISLMFSNLTLGIDINESNNVVNGLPDLKCKRIFIYSYWPMGPDEYVHCLIENIGNSHAYGPIHFNFRVKKSLFGVLNIRTIYKDAIINSNNEGLPPGRWYEQALGHCDQIPAKIGFYTFELDINPDKTIIESDYNNNFYSKTYFYIPYLWWYRPY